MSRIVTCVHVAPKNGVHARCRAQVCRAHAPVIRGVEEAPPFDEAPPFATTTGQDKWVLYPFGFGLSYDTFSRLNPDTFGCGEMPVDGPDERRTSPDPGGWDRSQSDHRKTMEYPSMREGFLRSK